MEFEEVYLESTNTRDMCPEMGILVGQALGRNHRTIVLGMDYMKSSRMMRDALMSGILSTGADVIDVGYVIAPAMSMMASKGDCAVYVTEYRGQDTISGYMIMDHNGCPFDRNAIATLNDILEYGPALSEPQKVGRIHRLVGCMDEYNERVCGMFENRSESSIILDCSCGCCALSAPQVLYASGSELVTINAQHDLNFHTSSRTTVTESELINLKQFISDYSGFIGIAMNRIGTQLDLVDEYGEQVPFNTLAAMIIGYLKPRCIAIPCDMDRLLVDAFNDIERPETDDNQDGVRVVFTEPDIGSVCNAILENGADLGFYDGYIIYGNGVASPDAIITSRVIADMATDNNISTIAESITPYHTEITEGEFECDSLDFETAFPFCIEKYEDWNMLSFKSGWRIDMKDGWVFVGMPSKEGNTCKVIAGSKDRAYLIGMVEVIKETIAYCSWGKGRADNQD